MAVAARRVVLPLLLRLLLRRLLCRLLLLLPWRPACQPSPALTFLACMLRHFACPKLQRGTEDELYVSADLVQASGCCLCLDCPAQLALCTAAAWPAAVVARGCTLLTAAGSLLRE